MTMENTDEDLTTAYMLGHYDGKKAALAANSHCSDSSGSDLDAFDSAIERNRAEKIAHGIMMGHYDIDEATSLILKFNQNKDHSND